MSNVSDAHARWAHELAELENTLDRLDRGIDQLGDYDWAPADNIPALPASLVGRAQTLLARQKHMMVKLHLAMRETDIELLANRRRTRSPYHVAEGPAFVDLSV